MELNNLASIVLYLAIFLSSITFAYIGQKTKRKTLVILSILLPSLLAGFRLLSGTDSPAYRTYYTDFLESNSNRLFDHLTDGSMEPFIILVSLVGNLLHLPVAFLFFVFAFITLVCFYKSTKLFSEKYSWLFYGMLLLIVFPEGFNMMRQLAAVSVEMLAMMKILHAYRNNEKVCGLQIVLLLLFSATLHFSSILLFPVFLMPLVVRHIRNKSLFVLLSSMAILFIAAFPLLIELIMSVGILSIRHYDALVGSEGSLININFIGCLILVFTLIASSHRKISQNDKQLCFLMLLGVIYSAVGFYSSYLGRMSEFFWVFIVMIASDVVCQLFEKESHRIGINLAAAIIYFIVYFGILGFNDIVPYSFGL